MGGIEVRWGGGQDGSIAGVFSLYWSFQNTAKHTVQQMVEKEREVGRACIYGCMYARVCVCVCVRVAGTGKA